MKKIIVLIIAALTFLAMITYQSYAAGPVGNNDLTKLNSGIPQYLSEGAQDVQLGTLLNSDGWASVGVTFTSAAMYKSVAHALGAVPNVVIITMTSPGTIFEYQAPDSANLYLSTTTISGQATTSCTVYMRAQNQVQN
jgi:hypothetical protein